MIVELGNHSAKANAIGIDDRPKVTTINIPEFDDGSLHPDAEYKGPHPHESGDQIGTLLKPGPKLGGYTYEPGLSVPEFQKGFTDALMHRDGIFRLPEHEVLLAVHNAWQASSNERPAWLRVRSHEETHGPTLPEHRIAPHSVDACKQLENFLHEHFGTDGKGAPSDLEDRYWTRFGEPGKGPVLGPPPITNLLTNNGRVIANLNDGGGAVGAIGVGTASTATVLTTTSTLVTNALVGYRIVVYSTASNNMVWGNVLANSNAAGASTITVDRWYTFATPGGSAGTTPSTPWAWAVLDGGFVSAWFVGLATGANVPAAADTTLATNGNVEYVTASGGFIRKISPYAQTSGVASRALTLTPVYTGNGSDTYPQTFTTIGVFCGMVVGSAGIMKFETALNASATVAASGDQLTVTETITGS